MDEKKSEVIFETEDELNLQTMGNIQAYKNKLFFRYRVIAKISL